ncbi:phosphotransferase [Peptostreptococcus russellii]|uniref:Putative pyruvate, phosphate dikinase regulatory protein n=1 Tax=Peptostreptococcus russellii TaxID=215200 RepID=A0A2P7Q1U5_9FIRM|nr:pyruvate, water dikinase regulatory protein [Peptostreptococcus russellii]PSJ31935.1 phosphotransferase [Peptostreptococcus russellii]
MKTTFKIFIVSDSLGETARAVARATISQFPDIESWDIKRFPYVNNEEVLKEVLKQAKESNALVLYSIVSKELGELARDICHQEKIEYVDLLSDIIEKLSKKFDMEPLREAGVIRKMDKSYFNRVEAIEFAVKYDDGKDPRGLLKADLVLVGISRTSKTPLSMYLANKHIKVANVPLVPEVPIPKELDSVEPRRIIGLTNSPEKLNVIRTERLKAMGLNGSANYAKLDRILEELDYSEEVMKRLKCPVINVANKAIEETAGIILDILKESDVDILKDYEI